MNTEQWIRVIHDYNAHDDTAANGWHGSMVREQGRNGLYVCPCCGYATLGEAGNYEICGICFWEDDGQDDPEAGESWGGPNGVSLEEGRRNFVLFGAAEHKDRQHVRLAGPDDEKVRTYKLVGGHVRRASST